jgi:branched-chain amino acid transport system permease protein
LGISLGASHFDPYFFDVIIGIGINIILAVSLNLINGYTGQFSSATPDLWQSGPILPRRLLLLGPKVLPCSVAQQPIGDVNLFVLAYSVPDWWPRCPDCSWVCRACV